jgi:hypothetical protein
VEAMPSLSNPPTTLVSLNGSSSPHCARVPARVGAWVVWGRRTIFERLGHSLLVETRGSVRCTAPRTMLGRPTNEIPCLGREREEQAKGDQMLRCTCFQYRLTVGVP